MDGVTTEIAAQVVSFVPEASLLERMPEVTPDRMWAMPLGLLMEKMPSAPVMSLDTWVRPEPVPGRDAPSSESLSETLSRYSIPRTASREWSTIIGSPAPLDKVMARFSRSITGVKVLAERLAGLPAAAPPLPAGRIPNAFLSIEVQGADAGDIDAAAALFSIQKSWISANEVHKWSIGFSRLDAGADKWTPHPAKRVREDQDRIYYAVVVPGFSTVAVTGSRTLPAEIFEVTGFAVSPATAVAGEPIIVRARVRAGSNQAEVFPATLWVDHEIEAHESVSVPAGGEAEVEFTFVRGEGQHEVRLERQVASIVVVSDSPGEATIPAEGDAILPNTGDYLVEGGILGGMMWLGTIIMVSGGLIINSCGRIIRTRRL